MHTTTGEPHTTGILRTNYLSWTLHQQNPLLTPMLVNLIPLELQVHTTSREPYQWNPNCPPTLVSHTPLEQQVHTICTEPHSTEILHNTLLVSQTPQEPQCTPLQVSHMSLESWVYNITSKLHNIPNDPYATGIPGAQYLWCPTYHWILENTSSLVSQTPTKLAYIFF